MVIILLYVGMNDSPEVTSLNITLYKQINDRRVKYIFNCIFSNVFPLSYSLFIFLFDRIIIIGNQNNRVNLIDHLQCAKYSDMFWDGSGPQVSLKIPFLSSETYNQMKKAIWKAGNTPCDTLC